MRHAFLKLLPCVVPVLIAACSAAPNDPTSDRAIGTSAAAATQATCPPLSIGYDGGPVVTSPRIFVLYWGHEWSQPAWTDYRANLDKVWRDFFTNPAFYAPVQRYGVNVGTYLGETDLLIDKTMPTKSDIDVTLQGLLNLGVLPTPDDNTIFYVVTSPSVWAEIEGSGAAHGAFINHNYFTGVYGGKTVNVKYAFSGNEYPGTVPNMDLLLLRIRDDVRSLYNTMTDPLGNGYYANTCYYDELGKPWMLGLELAPCPDSATLDGLNVPTLYTAGGCAGPGPSSHGLIFPPPPKAPGCSLASTCDNAFFPASKDGPAGYQTLETVTGTCASQASVIQQRVNGAWVDLPPYLPNASYPNATPNKFTIGKEASNGATLSGAPAGSSQSVRACATGPGGTTCDDPSTTLTIKNCCVPLTCNDTMCGSVSDGCGGTITCSGGCGKCKVQHCAAGQKWNSSTCACEDDSCTTAQCRCEAGGGSWVGNHCI